MSHPLIGALIGLIVAGIDMILLTKLSGRVEMPETKTVLTVVGLSQFVLFPVVGWFMADAIGGS